MFVNCYCPPWPLKNRWTVLWKSRRYRLLFLHCCLAPPPLSWKKLAAPSLRREHMSTLKPPPLSVACHWDNYWRWVGGWVGGICRYVLIADFQIEALSKDPVSRFKLAWPHVDKMGAKNSWWRRVSLPSCSLPIDELNYLCFFNCLLLLETWHALFNPEQSASVC